MKVLNAAVSTLVILAFQCLSVSEGYRHSDSSFEYTGYVAPSMDLFLREYDAFERPADELELDQKLLLLLENPDCWYNQRGRRVVLLFNETNFPEEYAIIRKTRNLFGSNDRLENNFLVLEEEQEREQYMNMYDQIRGFHDSDVLERKDAYAEIAGEEKNRYSYLDSYSESKIPAIKDIISEDLEKERYKSRIKKLIKMKDSTLIKIHQISHELRNLESSFIMECKCPECNICTDFQSHLNSKYIELNKQRRRYRMIISLFREFVDHSNRFDFEHNYDKCGDVQDLLGSGAKCAKDCEYFKEKGRKLAQVKRPNFNVTREVYGVDYESSYRELKRLLDESERELEGNGTDAQEPGEPVSTECTSERLEKLVAENERFSATIRGVRFFVESIFESSCPKCINSSHNGFTKFGDILNTQIRVLKYYQSEKTKLEDKIQSCIRYLENIAVKLDDDVQEGERGHRHRFGYLSFNEYNRKLNKIFEKYKEYGRDIIQFEKVVYGDSASSRLRPYIGHMCDINSLVLMNELSKEMMSRIVTSQVQKRVYLARKGCRMCSHNDCDRCHVNSKKLKALEGNIRAQNRLFKSISAYLDLCGFEQILASRILKRPSNRRDGVELEYFGKDGRLWSVEKYLSFPFIKRVLGLKGQLSPFLRAKVLERTKFTLQAFIRVLELSYLSMDKSECGSCKYGQCNDCYNKLTRKRENGGLIRSYNRLLSLVSFELDKYYVEMRKAKPGHGAGERIKEWILIRENSLREWLPNRPELVLKCDRESYSEAFAYYNEVLAERMYLLRQLEDVYNSIIRNNLKVSEQHFSKRAKEWESLWREKVYYDEASGYINRYLLSCASRNRKLNDSFHSYLEARPEIQRLYKSFQEKSEAINCLIENMRQVQTDDCIECSRVLPIRCGSYVVYPENIYQRLDSELKVFKLIRKQLDSYIYEKHLSYLDEQHQRKYRGRLPRYSRSGPGQHRSRPKFKEVNLDKIIVEYQDILRSPIPGMSTYLHQEDSRRAEGRLDTLQLSPESEFQCSKTEILVLQRLVSLLSQNQRRLNLLKSLSEFKCETHGCFVCEVRSKFHDSLSRELGLLESVLDAATEQLSQCLLDSKENFVGKQDIIEFQNSLLKLLKTESSFTADLKSHARTIKDLQCNKKEIERILHIRQDKSIKIYLWIEETLEKIQALTDENEQAMSDYITWTHQVTQLLDFSKLLEEWLQECINTINTCKGHRRDEPVGQGKRE